MDPLLNELINCYSEFNSIDTLSYELSKCGIGSASEKKYTHFDYAFYQHSFVNCSHTMDFSHDILFGYDISNYYCSNDNDHDHDQTFELEDLFYNIDLDLSDFEILKNRRWCIDPTTYPLDLMEEYTKFYISKYYHHYRLSTFNQKTNLEQVVFFYANDKNELLYKIKKTLLYLGYTEPCIHIYYNLLFS